MAKSKKSKQRKIAAKRGKKKAKRKQVLARQKRSASIVGLAGASTYPLHQTLLPGNLLETGMGITVFSRRLPDSRIAVGTFLVDVFCLGVKDAMARIMTEWEYEDYIDGVEEKHSLKAVEPACIVKLVEESVDYARDLGFFPHKDYRKARKIFGDVDPADCKTEFEFGKDGKPFYMSGPYDSDTKIRRIIDQLTERLGPDGFHFLVGMDEL
ncbi:MAG: hypothetical protein IH820_10860 [Bacteroidetes bacterium]|nr:hypothetical protein [Bacteroidota bacterium]